jgi:hypothetical protein
MSANAKTLGTRAYARGALLNPRAHARRNVFSIVLTLLALTALSATPAVAVAPSVPSASSVLPASSVPTAGGTVARLAYVTGTDREPTPSVWIAQANGREPKRLGPGLDPLLSPNGQSVAATLLGTAPNSEKGPALGIYSALGAPVADYLDLETANSTPLAWSPDSRYLAVMRQSTEVTNIAAGSGLDVIDTQTGTVTSIAEGQIYGASFAQDGSDRIVFARSPSLSPSAPTNLYVSNPDGSGLRRITSDGRSLNPVWGPRYIAYDREHLRRNYAPRYDIWLRSPAPGPSAARRLTNVPADKLVVGLVPIAFSASGSRLLSEFEGQDTSEAWTVRVPSGRARPVTVRNQSVVGAGISRDGGTLLVDLGSFESPPSSGRVASIPFAGGRPKVLVARGAQASWNR